jgi:hypothetical protein
MTVEAHREPGGEGERLPPAELAARRDHILAEDLGLCPDDKP